MDPKRREVLDTINKQSAKFARDLRALINNTLKHTIMPVPIIVTYLETEKILMLERERRAQDAATTARQRQLAQAARIKKGLPPT